MGRLNEYLEAIKSDSKEKYYLLNEVTDIPVHTNKSEIITFISKDLAKEFNKKIFERVKADLDPEDKEDDVIVKEFKGENFESKWKYIIIKDKKDFENVLKEF